MTDVLHRRSPRLRTGIVVTTTDGGRHHATVELHGELCAATAPLLAGELDRLLDDGITDLSLDVSQLTLCTSHGLDLWDDLHGRLRSRDGTGVEICGARGSVRRVLHIVRDADPTFSPVITEPQDGAARSSPAAGRLEPPG